MGTSYKADFAKKFSQKVLEKESHKFRGYCTFPKMKNLDRESFV